MKKDDLIEFLNKEIVITDCKGWKYQGVLKKLSDSTAKIIDIKVGIMIIDLDDIKRVFGVQK